SLVLAAGDALDAVHRQPQAAPLEPFLETGLRVLQLGRRGQLAQPALEQPVDDRLRGLGAAVEADRADQRFDRVREHRAPAGSARAVLAGADGDYRVDAETLSNRGQGRLVRERGAGAAQIALLVVRPELVQALRDREVQE